MIKAGAVLVALAVPLTGFGAYWTVCVQDTESLLNTPLRAAMLREFREVIGSPAASLRFAGCEEGAGQVLLEIKGEPPPPLKDVLGLAHRRHGRIEPKLEIFYGPMVRYLGGPNSFLAIGRALARVAAHEAAHFLEQQSGHCGHGLLRATFPAHELLADNSEPFRRDRSCREVKRKPDGKPVETLAAAGRTRVRALPSGKSERRR